MHAHTLLLKGCILQMNLFRNLWVLVMSQQLLVLSMNGHCDLGFLEEGTNTKWLMVAEGHL